MKKYKAFSLAEVLIVMALIGVLAVILLPNTKSLVPNKSLTMFKKAFAVTGQVVSNLLEDEDLYPVIEDDSANISGLDNTEAAIYKTEEHEGETKFCYLFAEMLNISSDIKCDDTGKEFKDGELPQGHFTTTDGIVWILPITLFDEDKEYEIYVDINGDGAPNSFVSDSCTPSNSDGSSSCNGQEPDRFIITLTKDGKLGGYSDIEKFYLKSENASAKYYSAKNYSSK